MPPSRPEPAPRDDLLAEILSAPDRDGCPFARPVVSWSDQDEEAYLASIEAAALASVTLQRRGVDHGDWAELDAARAGVTLPDDGDDAAFEGFCSVRWQAARPIVLPGVAASFLPELAPELDDAASLFEELCETGGLAGWLTSRAADLAPEFEPLARRAPLADPERDLERMFVAAHPPPGGGGRTIDDLWIKSAWLSTHEDERSLRVRMSFGREGDDDGSADLLRHRLVTQLGERLFPETVVAGGNPDLVRLVERLCGTSVLFTQMLAYWNAPGGGASFHHDAFAEDELDGGAQRQLGVCYVQLTGATAWLALSTADLAARIAEFAEALEEGELPWLRAQLFEAGPHAFPGGWRRFRALLADGPRLASELSLPGCGALGPLVNRGPEFTSFLADAGHGCILRAGDAILLPNFGLRSTCMHSVFCAGDDVAYSLSFALRPDRESPAALLAEEARRRERVESARAAAAARRERRRERRR